MKLLLILLLVYMYHNANGQIEIEYVENNEQNCSNEKGQQGNLKCIHAHVRSFGRIATELMDVLAELDQNSLVRRIFLDVHTNSSELHLVAPIVDSQLDTFFTPRPWWLLLSESRTLHKNTNVHMVHMFLLRYSQLWESNLRAFAAVQYPPEGKCDSFPLYISRMMYSGYGSQNNLWEGEIGHPFRIFNIWDSKENNPDEAMLYASKGVCPDLINKRLCAFLPLTNCTMPKFLTETKGPEFESKCWKNSFVLYSSASEEGQVISADTNVPMTGYQKELESQLGSFLTRGKPFITSDFYDALGRKLPTDTNPGDSIKNPSVIATLKTQAFLFRPNSRYRRMVMEKVHTIRDQENFPLGTQCASIHIRRGDRVAPNGVRDVKEFCSHYRRFNTNGSCVNIDDPNDKSDVIDYGCFSQHPYGTLSLVDYLDRAEIILANKSKTVFVMTDDAHWLKSEIANLNNTKYKEWTIHSLPALYDKHSMGYDPIAENHETEAGVEFLVSVALARQCQHFVGHFGSGFTVTLFRALCFQHEFVTGKCPIGYDIGYGYDPENGRQQWLPPMNINSK